MSSSTHHGNLVDDDVLSEILLRLPPTSVLRSRAVCKHWRRVTTCIAFLDAYSRRRPLELLVYPDGYKTGPGPQNIVAALDLVSSVYYASCRRFLRFDTLLHLVDCRDGLLLFARGRTSFLICNPATRQYVTLPLMVPEPFASVVASGLYFHRPSGEHRLLFIGDTAPPSPNRGDDDDDALPAGAHYYIFSMGAGADAKIRRLGAVADDSDGSKRAGRHITSACVAIGGTLHWSRHPESADKMVAFDMLSETFRLIAPPPPFTGGGGKHLHLRQFDMEGTLAVSAVDVTVGSPRLMDIWALEDDNGELWSCRHRVSLPRARLHLPTDEAVAVVDDGRVLVLVGGGWVLLFTI